MKHWKNEKKFFFYFLVFSRKEIIVSMSATKSIIFSLEKQRPIFENGLADLLEI